MIQNLYQDGVQFIVGACRKLLGIAMKNSNPNKSVRSFSGIIKNYLSLVLKGRTIDWLHRSWQDFISHT